MSTSVHSAFTWLRQQRPAQAPAAAQASAERAPVLAQDSFDIDGLKGLLDQLQPPAAAPVPSPAQPPLNQPATMPKPKPKPGAPGKPGQPGKPRPKPGPKKVYTVKDLPKSLDVTYGSFKSEIKNADMVATSGTRAYVRKSEKHDQLLGDLVKSGDWFDKNGRLTLSAEQIADALSRPFEGTLAGTRPEGAKAVVFDEVNDRLNVAPKTFARGLALAKKRHPNRPIIVYLSHPDRLDPILLKAVEKHADRVLVENYFWESRENGRITPDDLNKDYAPIARIAPGILKKAHPVLAISEKPGPYNFNDRKDVNFKRFLNDQAYALQHNAYTKHMRGLGAYATYEASPETLKFFDKLVKWYSKDGRNKKMPL